MPGQRAVKERAFHILLGEAENDDRFGRRIAVTFKPVGIYPADGRRQSKRRAVQIDGARLAVVANKDLRLGLFFRRQ